MRKRRLLIGDGKSVLQLSPPQSRIRACNGEAPTQIHYWPTNPWKCDHNKRKAPEKETEGRRHTRMVGQEDREKKPKNIYKVRYR